MNKLFNPQFGYKCIKTFIHHNSKANKNWITHYSNTWYQDLPDNLKLNFIPYFIE